MAESHPGGPTLATRRSEYTLEFKQEAVRLVSEESLTFAQVGKDLGVDQGTVRTCCRQAATGQLGGVTSPTRPMRVEDELANLRQEN